ncbi:MAG: carboxymuconolactone decarboxylase family protein [Alkalispirochaeta sp.]
MKNNDKKNNDKKEKPAITLPDAITSRGGFKRKFSLWELYRSLVFVPRAVIVLGKNRKRKLLDGHFVERLQLAVTEVNGCPACSYQHTKMALRQNMSNEEISSFLSGADDFIRSEEAKAIMFAQHFADSRGFPEKYAYDAIVTEYGVEEAHVILAACQVMIAGNMYGIPISALQSRLKGKPYKDSSLFYELGMAIVGFLSLPFAIIHALLRGLIGLSNERFAKSTDA